MLPKAISPLNPGSRFGQGYTISNTVRVQPYSKKELCDLYNVKHRVLAGWLARFKDEIGEITGRYYTAKQVEIIFDKIGLPYDIKEDE
ncbi:MAG: hypothetical protein U0T68_08130 [Ferruginibacter sp.]